MIINIDEFVKSKILTDLNCIVISTNVFLEGGCIYNNTNKEDLGDMMSNIRRDEDVDKVRNNLFSLSKKSQRILQIGVNACHSCALFYHANPDVEIVGFDLFNHEYTDPCTNYLSFNRRLKLKMIRGNTMDTLAEYNSDRKFDVIHVDGGHEIDVLRNDIEQCRRFANQYTYLVIDDTNLDNHQEIISECIAKNLIKEVDYDVDKLHSTPLHRIFHYL